LNPTSLTLDTLSTTNQFGYDAIGFNQNDGFMYGISNRNAVTGDTIPHVVRVDRLGGITDLGTVHQLAGQEWTIGTFVLDGTYFIAAITTNNWLQLDVTTTPPTVVASGNTAPFNIPSAWAADPLSNMIIGYQLVEANHLSVFDPTTKAFTLLEPPVANIGQEPCSAAFTKTGEYLLDCKTADPAVDKLFTVDLVTHVATPLASLPPLAAGEMTSCVFRR
jgi:hypothetical protein